MPNPIWSGAISFGLVSIPVRLYPATESKSVRFNMLHRHDGSRVKERYFCQLCGEPLELHQMVKGYEVSPGRYVEMTNEDFDLIPVKSLHTIDIEQFVDLAQIDPILFEHTYFVAPEKIRGKPFSLLLATMRDAGKAAVGRLTLRQKEKAVVLRFYQGTVALSILLAPDEVRTTDSLKVPPVEVGPEAVEAAVAYIEALSTPFKPEAHKDGYREALLALINEKADALPKEERTSPVSALPDLMAALRASVEESRLKKEKAAELSSKKSRKKEVLTPA